MTILEAISPTSAKLLKSTKAQVCNSPKMLEVFVRISEFRLGRRAAVRAGLVTLDLAHSTPDSHRKLRVLVQSVGQVGEALEGIELRDSTAHREELRDKLSELAAHTVAWLEALE